MSSRRLQGPYRVRARLVAGTGGSRPRTHRPGRLWQHVGSNCSVRSRASHSIRPSIADAADGNGAGIYRKLRRFEESLMIPAVVLLGAVTAERLAELWLARRNTADASCKRRSRIRAQSLSRDRPVACVLACKPMAFRLDASAQFVLADDLFSPAGSARLDSDDPWSTAGPRASSLSRTLRS